MGTAMLVSHDQPCTCYYNNSYYYYYGKYKICTFHQFLSFNRLVIYHKPFAVCVNLKISQKQPVMFYSATPMVTWVIVAMDMAVATPTATVMEDLALVVSCPATFTASSARDLLIPRSSRGSSHTLRTAVLGISSKQHSKTYSLDMQYTQLDYTLVSLGIFNSW